MINGSHNSFYRYLTKMSPRSKNVVKNIIYISVIKCVNIGISFLIIPLTLNYLSDSVYGIWLTMYSVVSWLMFFDVGLGNGLRNKLSSAMANQDAAEAKQLVSTAYISMGALSFILFLISALLIGVLDWQSILKLPQDYAYSIKITLLWLCGAICIRFVVQLISTICFAIQQSFLTELINLVSNILSLGMIYFGRAYVTGDKLLFLVFALAVPPVVVMILFSAAIFLSKKFSYLRPAFSSFRKRMIDSLVNLGVKFFVLQICGLVVYALTNFLILRFLNPADVTDYNIAYKYFSALLILNNIICAPLWSAFTEAYTKQDYAWIKNCIRKMRMVFMGITAMGLLMLIFSRQFYDWWLQTDLPISFWLSLWTYIFILVCCYNGIIVSFINGVGKIKLQMIIAIVTTILYIPACYILSVKLGFGVCGFVAFQAIANLLSSFFGTIQTNKLVENKANGIWNN